MADLPGMPGAADRPRLHLTPPAGWMNDPNGLFFVDGRTHVTYQHNPDDAAWGRMHWGHAVTEDLVSWTHRPVALTPSDDGPDSFGCWSGNVVDGGSEAIAWYTGVRLVDGTRVASICRATSRDGLRTWQPDPANPFVAAPPPGVDPDRFRDPLVWRDEGAWSMLVGGGTLDGHGCVLLYRSTNMRAWQFERTLLAAADVDPAADADGPVWECPQLIRENGVDVLVVSVVDRAPGIRPSHVAAISGRLVGGHFEVAAAQQPAIGPDFYAPAASRMPDGRWLLFGWVPEDSPAPDSGRDWAGALTLPRIISVGADGRARMAFAREVEACRGGVQRRRPQVLASTGEGLAATGTPVAIQLPNAATELEIVVQPDGASEIVLELLDGHPDEPEARISYRPEDSVLLVARRGIVSVAGRSSASTTTLAPPDDGPSSGVRFRVIVDASILELEANGHTMATLRLPARLPHPRSFALRAVGGVARLESLRLWRLRPPGDPGHDG